ncbi:YihY/virulence factor BrkB family protein [Corynebacterium flavescens]|uniref:YihY/virulence factor BrkB family protein n=1 Tax=Corynebacterium flavescens TaxID=28028 RepID=UPI003F918BFC
MNSQEKPDRQPDRILPPRGVETIGVDSRDEYESPLGRGNRLSAKSWALVLRRTWNDFFFEGFLDRGATLTYFTLMAFAPTVLAAYSIATLVFASRRAQVEEITQEFIAEYLPAQTTQQASDLVGTIIGSSAQGTIALVLSVLISLFSASAYVRAFSRTANMVYGRVEGRGLIRAWGMMWVLTVVLVLGAVTLVFANLARDTVISGILGPIAGPLGLEDTLDFMLRIFLPVWDWLRLPLSVLLVLALIAVLYHFAPNVRPQRFRWFSLGSVLALVATVAVWWLIGLYLQYFAGLNAYGALSVVLAVLVAVWITNTALIVGLKIDAEVLRAKELQRGLESQRHIQAPPRSDEAALAQAQTQQRLEDKGEQIRTQAEENKAEKIRPSPAHS